MQTLTLDDATRLIARQAAEIIRLQETIAVMKDGEVCPYCGNRDATCTCYAPLKDGEK